MSDANEKFFAFKWGFPITVTSEQAMAAGLIEPYPEERARYEAERQARKAETAWWLKRVDAVTDPLARVVLDLHCRNGSECAECVRDDMDYDDWPCETVRLVMAYLGHPAPEWVEL